MELTLVILLLLPAIGAIACAFVTERSARAVALGASLLCMGLGALLGYGAFVNPDTGQFGWNILGAGRFEADLGGIREIGFRLRLAITPISFWLIILTVFLQPLAIAASFDSIRQRQKEYYAWMLALLSAMLGVFMARDALLFYVFFELTLVPMFFIIGIWGGPQRRYAAGKFFLSTFAGSVFTLAAIIYLGLRYEHFDIDTLVRRSQDVAGGGLTGQSLILVSLGLLVGFMVKVPLFPLHTWLPLAHTEAPTAGSVILAGVLLKLGTYGLLVFVVPIAFVGAAGSLALRWMIMLVAILSLIGIIYGALAAWVQQDIKKLVAYSSVSHLGFCVLGLTALNAIGVQGSVLYMINHGLSTGAMFLVVGMIYDRYHTRDINELSGLGRRMPVLAFFFVLFVLSSIGLPGLNGFVSEFLTILGAFSSSALINSRIIGAIAAIGVVLGALYMLHMTARVIFGPLKTPEQDAGHGQYSRGSLPRDLNAREIGVLTPLALAVVLLGIAPNVVLKPIEPPIQQMLTGRMTPPNMDGQAMATTATPVAATRMAETTNP